MLASVICRFAAMELTRTSWEQRTFRRSRFTWTPVFTQKELKCFKHSQFGTFKDTLQLRFPSSPKCSKMRWETKVFLESPALQKWSASAVLGQYCAGGGGSICPVYICAGGRFLPVRCVILIHCLPDGAVSCLREAGTRRFPRNSDSREARERTHRTANCRRTWPENSRPGYAVMSYLRPAHGLAMSAAGIRRAHSDGGYKTLVSA